MRKTECLAMILAGGQGSRLGALTKNIAKPAVPFGGKYRIIDFPLSNCANSGIETVGVLTQYRPLELHTYLGTGEAWNLDRKMVVYIFYLHMLEKKVQIGIKVQQMQFIKILILSIKLIQIMY